MRLHLLLASIVTAAIVTPAPHAHADDTVTYEVLTTSDIPAVNVEYYDTGGLRALQQVPLPWRMNVTVGDPRSNDAEIRADWRSLAKPSKWVTARIYYRGSLLCENTLDVGNAACYGSTTFKN